MIVFVDMDGVLANFTAGLRAEWIAQHGSCPLPPDEEFDKWDMYDLIPHDQHAILDEVMATRGLFYGLPPIEGGRQAIQEMEAAGLDVFICTTPLASNPGSGEEKIAWVKRHLGGHLNARTVFTWDKTLLGDSGDLLIDDKPVISGLRIPKWEQIVFTQPYNRSVAGKRRLDSWADWRMIQS